MCNRRSNRPVLDVAAALRGCVENARAGEGVREIPDAIVDALTVLFTFFGHRLEPSNARMYARTLEELPAAVLQATVERAIETRVFMPRPVELRQDLEVVRKALRAQQPYQPCPRCAQTPGWIDTVACGSVEIVNERGRLETTTTSESTRAVRCPCSSSG